MKQQPFFIYYEKFRLGFFERAVSKQVFEIGKLHLLPSQGAARLLQAGSRQIRVLYLVSRS